MSPGLASGFFTTGKPLYLSSYCRIYCILENRIHLGELVRNQGNEIDTHLDCPGGPEGSESVAFPSVDPLLGGAFGRCFLKTH